MEVEVKVEVEVEVEVKRLYHRERDVWILACSINEIVQIRFNLRSITLLPSRTARLIDDSFNLLKIDCKQISSTVVMSFLCHVLIAY